MRCNFLPIAILMAVLGCSSSSTDTTVTPPVDAGSSTKSSGKTAPDASTELALSPSNTLIQFVGTHVGEKPDPKARTGKFEEFTGRAVVVEDELKSVEVEIQMASVRTGIEKLDNHLQNEDFFGVREYPTAHFNSTRIARNEDGDHMITGNLTLHAETKEVSFPAKVSMVDGQLELSAKLQLDRTEYGMDKKTDAVNKEVDLTLQIGKLEE